MEFMQKKSERITVIAILVMLLAISVVVIVMPKKNFSENENRYLKSFPEFSMKSFFSGDYMDDLEDYLTDHFAFRDFWVSVDTEKNLILGEKEMNDILIGQNGQLFGAYHDPVNNETIEKILKNFGESTARSYPEISMKIMLVPTALTVYAEDIPSGAVVTDQRSTIAEYYDICGIDYVDVTDAIVSGRKSGRMYYKTDHHWTTRGAYQAYAEYCKSAELSAVDIELLDSETVTEDFHGTYSSKVNRPFEEGDSIEVFYNRDDNLKVYYSDADVYSDTLYNLEYAAKKDKYSLFLDNLHSLIVVENDKSETDRVLLLIKDSYANSMVPFLATNYRKIYILDTRYYKMGPSVFISENADITDILILYNLGTMDTDIGIRAIF